MSTGDILILGAFAGATILLGLPIARLRNPSTALKAFLTSMATGILVFLFWDVMSNGVEPIEEAIRAHGFAHVSSYSALLLGGFGLGFMGLIGYERWMHGHRRRSLLGPGAASAVEFETVYPMGLTPPRFLALLIATGIGLHNFAEGLAIGQSAASGQLQLAIALIVGFGLHNATEGFGIVAPLTGERRVPSWRFLLLLGLIGGGPTFVGTVVGQAWVSTSLSILFLGLAAGSILYVVMQLLTICRTFGHASLAAWGITTGLVLGFATDFILVGLGV
jgi:zinc transporter, ZIP family